ncbi:MAG: hypothetical protein ABR568_10900 [Pyrinomonadaceae bacterium]
MAQPEPNLDFTASLRLDVLKTLYSQVQSTAITLRDWIAKLFTGVIGFLLVIDGWVVTSSSKLTFNQRVAIVCGVTLVSLIALYAIKQIHNEVLAVGILIVRVETAMGLYTKDVFMKGSTLYPNEYGKLGTEDYEHGKHIYRGPFLLIGVFALFSVALVLLV